MDVSRKLKESTRNKSSSSAGVEALCVSCSVADQMPSKAPHQVTEQLSATRDSMMPLLSHGLNNLFMYTAAPLLEQLKHRETGEGR